nr:hypothetical protein CFP56_76490 [Quercus suber]
MGPCHVLPLMPRWPERRRDRGHRVAGGGAHRRGACLRSISAPGSRTTVARRKSLRSPHFLARMDSLVGQVPSDVDFPILLRTGRSFSSSVVRDG